MGLPLLSTPVTYIPAVQLVFASAAGAHVATPPLMPYMKPLAQPVLMGGGGGAGV